MLSVNRVGVRMSNLKAVTENTVHEPQGYSDELQEGATLLSKQFKVVSYLSSGGFGIAYIVKDRLSRSYLIKECFINDLCRRHDQAVIVRSPQHQEIFDKAVKLFVREAKRLAKFEHPNVVKVKQVFEANNTAYMVLELIEGDDLQTLIEEGNSFAPDQIVSMMKKLLLALEHVHAGDILHRDISPDNIMIDTNDQPVLIDFGSAKEEFREVGKAVTELRAVKEGYSPHEFYVAGSTHTPASDLYSLGATFYHLISGEAPENSQSRLASLASTQEDIYKPLAGNIEGYPQNFLEMIDNSLNVMPAQRPQSAGEWLDQIKEDTNVSNLFDAREKQVRIVPVTESEKVTIEEAPEQDNVAAELSENVVAKASSSRMPMIMGATAVAALLAGGAFFVMSSGGETPALMPENTPSTASEVVTTNPVVTPTAVSVTETVVAPIVTAPVVASETEAQSQEAVAVSDPSEIIVFRPIDTPTAVAPAPTSLAAAMELLEEPATETTPTSEPVVRVLSLSDIVDSTEWSISLPFKSEVEFTPDEGLVMKVVNVSQEHVEPSAEWLQPGVEISRINGSGISDLSPLLHTLLDKTADTPYAAIPLSLFVRPSGGTSYYVETLSIYQSANIVLHDGTKLENTFEAGEWTLRVMDASGAGADKLRAGDVILSANATGTEVRKIEDIDDAIKIASENGDTGLDLRVMRGTSETDVKLAFPITN